MLIKDLSRRLKQSLSISKKKLDVEDDGSRDQEGN